MASAAAYHPNDSYKTAAFLLAAAARRAGRACGVRDAALAPRRYLGRPRRIGDGGLVGNVPAIPLPHPDVSTTSRVVDNTKGLYKAEPPKIEPPPPDALPIPKFKELKPSEDSAQANDAYVESRAAAEGRSASVEDSRESNTTPAQCDSLWTEAERRRFPRHRSPWGKEPRRAG